MNTITIKEVYDKLKEQTEIIEDIEVAPPNKIIKCKGKPDIISIYYNNRWYSWELVV